MASWTQSMLLIWWASHNSFPLPNVTCKRQLVMTIQQKKIACKIKLRISGSYANSSLGGAGLMNGSSGRKANFSRLQRKSRFSRDCLPLRDKREKIQKIAACSSMSLYNSRKTDSFIWLNTMIIMWGWLNVSKWIVRNSITIIFEWGTKVEVDLIEQRAV